jgi:transposase
VAALRRGLDPGDDATLDAPEIVTDELAAKPEFASLVESLLAMRASIADRIEALDGRLRAWARCTPLCRRFITVPGVGPITALAKSRVVCG